MPQLAGAGKVVEILQDTDIAQQQLVLHYYPTTTFGTATGVYDGSQVLFNGDKVKGDGYYGFSDGVHTVQTRVTSFVGTLKNPKVLLKKIPSTDWVDVNDILIGDGSTAITQLS